jgi:SAM-dependent methyltransferase
MTQDKEYLRTTFDEEAILYDEVRPGYPEELFDDIVSLSGIPPHGSILEIGSGTGQATVPLARRGYRILCVEIGPHLAAVARQKLAIYPEVKIHTGAFEEWPIEEHAFDLAISATAFHWISPTISYKKVAQALKPAGAIALFWHVHVQSQTSQGFFGVVQGIYQRDTPQLAKNFRPLPQPNEVGEPVTAEIEQTGLFDKVTTRRYCWDVTYDAVNYIRLLNTYSNHRALAPDVRDCLFHDIIQLIDTQFYGHITKGYMAILYVAHRK